MMHPSGAGNSSTRKLKLQSQGAETESAINIRTEEKHSFLPDGWKLATAGGKKNPPEVIRAT